MKPPVMLWRWGLCALLVLALLGLVLLTTPAGLDAEGWPTPARALDELRRQVHRTEAWQADHPLLFALGYFLIFALLSAAAIPGCGALALLAGPCFGWFAGTLMVGAASTAGAVVAFALARRLLRERLQNRYGDQLLKLDRALDRHGHLLVFWLRLVPLLPYPLLNPLLGLTRLNHARFVWPSLAGLTLGSLPYVLAGASLDAGLPQGGLPVALAGVAALALALPRWARRRLAASPLS